MSKSGRWDRRRERLERRSVKEGLREDRRPLDEDRGGPRPDGRAPPAKGQKDGGGWRFFE